jgi:dTDP-4-amino-4,6-dideoxygalactose transaminase
MDWLREAAGDIPIIEDAACAAGAAYKGRTAGSLGELGCFSFHPRKSITTGEGGMVTTNDDELAEKVNVLRNHGASISEEQRHHGAQPYLLPEFNALGFNYRMTDLQGAVGVVQLRKLDGFIAERQRWASFYEQELADSRVAANARRSHASAPMPGKRMSVTSMKPSHRFRATQSWRFSKRTESARAPARMPSTCWDSTANSMDSSRMISQALVIVINARWRSHCIIR